jgi:perosamine synthetase
MGEQRARTRAAGPGVRKAGKVIGYGRQLIDDDDVAAVVSVLRSDFLTQGEIVPRFEAALAERVGARHVVAVSNGTAALHIACLAAGLKPPATGVTSAITFVASANCIRYCGAKASVVDIEPDGLAMSPTALGAHLARTPDTSVVIPVHIAGLSCGMAELRAAAAARTVIEDASHALGATEEDGQPVGACAHADMATFSFHPVKPITTGEGGAVTTNDPELYRRLLLFRNHGLEREADRLEDRAQAGAPWYYEQQVMGLNYRLTDVQAALGLSQLKKLDRFLARRRQIAASYDAAFASLRNLRPLQARERHRSALHLYVVAIDFAALGKSRGTVMSELRARGVGTQVHYIPVHHHPIHRAAAAEACPNAERYYSGCLSLPLHAAMSDSDVTAVVDAVKHVVGAPA